MIEKKRRLFVIVLLLVLWSAIAGWLGSLAFNAPAMARSLPQQQLKLVDPVPERYQLGLELYRDRCGSCHLAIPPQVFPTQTWQQLLQNPQDHYGTKVTSVIRPELLIMWDYLSTFSRPLEEGEETPYRFSSSRYFKILHPRVELPEPISHVTCLSCHPAAREFEFRRLAPEWEDAP
ncbi:MAG: diheme cytochrome C [Cyanobacteriota bacterium]|nr:diheme cytochrome C [Cyanobacteriota bacterium]